jgi:hypothetical protein
MFGFDEDDGECTADIGPFGYMGCHRYPGCGCGQSTTPVDTRPPDVQNIENWDQQLEGMTFTIDLQANPPANLRTKSQSVIERQGRELNALINKHRAELAKLL